MTISLVDNCSTSNDVHVAPDALGIGVIGMGRIRREEPVVQPTVAYGRCVAGNGGVLSVLTMNSGHLPATDRREAVFWKLPAAGGGEARLCGMVNVCEVLINPVRDRELKLLFKALAKRHAVGSPAWRFGDADITTVGEQTPPNPRVLSTRNWVNPYRCLIMRRGFETRLLRQTIRSIGKRTGCKVTAASGYLGRRTARGAVAGAGRGGRKKRMAVL